MNSQSDVRWQNHSSYGQVNIQNMQMKYLEATTIMQDKSVMGQAFIDSGKRYKNIYTPPLTPPSQAPPPNS